MNVIFLDIDGVLNNYATKARTPMGYTGINNSLAKRLSELVKETDSVVVLTSTWKDDWDIDPNKRAEDGRYLHLLCQRHECLHQRQHRCRRSLLR